MQFQSHIAVQKMAAIKRFFEKRKVDLKFKKLGEGKKLTEAEALASSTKQFDLKDKSGSASRMAAQAAMARYSQPKPGSSLGTSHKSIELQVNHYSDFHSKSIYYKF